MTGRPRDMRRSPPREYQSYLLRMWRVDQGESAVWRTSLEDTRTGQWHSFADLDAAFRFLAATGTQMAASQEGDHPYPPLPD